MISVWRVLTYRKHVVHIDQDNFDKYGQSMILLYLPLSPLVIVNDAEVARKILVSEQKSFHKCDLHQVGNHYIRSLFGLDNIVFHNGRQWRQQRAIFTPLFSKLDTWVPVALSKAQEFMCMLDRSIAGSHPSNDGMVSSATVEIGELMQRFNVDVLGEALLGHDFGCIRGETRSELRAFHTVLDNAFTITRVILPFLDWLPLKVNRMMDESLLVLNRMMDKLLLQQAQVSNISATHDDTIKSSMLYNMIANGELSNQQIRDNSLVYFFAAHDSTTNALAFCLCCLAMYQHEQQKLYQAVGKLPSVVKTVEALNTNSSGSHTRVDFSHILDYDELNSCAELDYFIKETLRLYPPFVRPTVRRTNKRVVLDGYNIRKGMHVFIDIHALHRNVNYWKNPEQFWPERFSPENSRGRPPFAYIPFGGGSRVCLGRAFANAQLKCMLAFMVLRYRLSTEPGFERIRIDKGCYSNIIWTLERGFKLRLHKRM